MSRHRFVKRAKRMRVACLTAVFAIYSTKSLAASAPEEKIFPGLGEVSERGRAAYDVLSSLSDGEASGVIERGLKTAGPRAKVALLHHIADRKLTGLFPSVMIAGLHDEEWRVRDAAVHVAGRLMDADAAGFLRQKVADENSFVRVSAIQDLDALGLPEDSGLFAKLMTSDDPATRLAAGVASAGRGGAVDRNLALQYIESSTPSVRNIAISLVGETGAPDDIVLLNKLMDKASVFEKWKMRIAVTQIQLRQTPASQKLDFLKKNISERNQLLRQWAAIQLLTIPGGDDALKEVAANSGHRGREQALDALAVSQTLQWKRRHAK